jgi:hypothetical protein
MICCSSATTRPGVSSGTVGHCDGDTGAYVGDTGAYVGDTGAYVGDTGAYVGDTGAYVGDVGAYVGDAGSLHGDKGGVRLAGGEEGVVGLRACMGGGESGGVVGTTVPFLRYERVVGIVNVFR